MLSRGIFLKKTGLKPDKTGAKMIKTGSKMIKTRHGTITLFLVFLITAIILVLISAVFAPMGILFTQKMYIAGEGIINRSADDLASISDLSMREAINGSISSAKAATLSNIEVNSALFKYGGIVVLGITALILFLYSRRLVEINSGLI